MPFARTSSVPSACARFWRHLLVEFQRQVAAADRRELSTTLRRRQRHLVAQRARPPSNCSHDSSPFERRARIMRQNGHRGRSRSRRTDAADTESAITLSDVSGRWRGRTRRPTLRRSCYKMPISGSRGPGLTSSCIGICTFTLGMTASPDFSSLQSLATGQFVNGSIGRSLKFVGLPATNTSSPSLALLAVPGCHASRRAASF